MKWGMCVFVARKKKLRMIETPEGRLPGVGMSHVGLFNICVGWKEMNGTDTLF